jgi:hypothetical protein
MAEDVPGDTATLPRRPRRKRAYEIVDGDTAMAPIHNKHQKTQPPADTAQHPNWQWPH